MKRHFLPLSGLDIRATSALIEGLCEDRLQKSWTRSTSSHHTTILALSITYGGINQVSTRATPPVLVVYVQYIFWLASLSNLLS
jgi:hypothetical protein